MRIRKLFFSVFVVLVLFSGCSKDPKPEDRFADFVANWRDQNFSEMYDQLTANVKKNIKKDEFVSRYEKIYQDSGVKQLKIDFKKPKEEIKPDKNGNITFPFAVSMETLAGKISFENKAVLKKEETDNGNDWRIEWNPSFIFPQLDEGEEISIQPIAPERGEIFDRNGKGLAINGLLFEIGVVPGEMKEQKETILEQTAKLLEVSKEEIEKKLSQGWVKEDSFVPLKIVNPADTELVNKLLAIPSVKKKNVTGRMYPFGESAAHLTGYLRSMYKEELEKYEEKGYSSSEQIGAAGLEQVFEDELHGTTGWIIKVKGTDEVIAKKEAENGNDIYLTIDADLQQNIYKELSTDSGASVAINPKTGETLAMVSAPSYDPNDFLTEYKKKKDDPNKPFMAKFKNLYTPGSVLKPLTAAIGLNTGTIDPNKKISIPKDTWQKDGSWGNYYIKRVPSPATQVDLRAALAYSDNIYFAQAALNIGAEKFIKGLESFAFNEKIDFPFPVETSKVANNGMDNEVLLADSGYGQGQIQITPLHLAYTFTVFINGGNMIKPVLIKEEEKTPSNWKSHVVSKEHANLIFQDLIQVVEDPNGTAYKPRTPGLKLAGKTGTAELKAAKGEKGQENGWFVAVDADKKDLLITMMIERVEDRGGSHYVVSKVKNIFKARK
ncbi:penicillin-binding transpeptidase domain-containing protein [Aeribacillus sp. FSL k6-2211]|uniref:penicillin-binding transpeptidase domain-containing protein n=1 Tax=unclassified Aeribacillus TaxID=2640495 RepID=UPI00403F6012